LDTIVLFHPQKLQSVGSCLTPVEVASVYKFGYNVLLEVSVGTCVRIRNAKQVQKRYKALITSDGRPDLNDFATL
jgi:hypothetical protein